MHTNFQRSRIGVFDSGVGGLTILRALRAVAPRVSTDYVADSGHGPYGERSPGYILERSRHIARFLRDRNADMLVIACNTATAAAIETLRAENPGWPIVGIEPGIKPAATLSRTGRVGVMATSSTLTSARFRRLLDTHGRDVQWHLQACPGLAAAIEVGEPDSAELKQFAQRYAQPLRDAGCDVIVLGCTHYPFVQAHLRSALGSDVTLLDTADAVAHRILTLLEEHHQPTDSDSVLWTSGDPAAIARFSLRWLATPMEVRPLPC